MTLTTTSITIKRNSYAGDILQRSLERQAIKSRNWPFMIEVARSAFPPEMAYSQEVLHHAQELRDVANAEESAELWAKIAGPDED